VNVAIDFISSVPSPTDGGPLLRVLIDDALLALLLLALLSLPVTIVNSTAEANADRIGALTARLSRRLQLARAGAWAHRVPLAGALAVSAVLSAVLYGFVEPSFGLDRASMTLVLGISLALLFLNCMERLSQIFYLQRAHHVRASMDLFPGFALVAIACVLISRVTGLQPGLVLGPLATMKVAKELDESQKGRAMAMAYIGLTLLSTVAWVTRSWAMGLVGDTSSVASQTVGVAWTTLIVSGVLGILFNIVPMRFLQGADLLAWSKVTWAAFAAFGAIGFAHLVFRPESGPGDFARRTTYLLIMLAVYLVVAVAFWAWFRYRPARQTGS
jgi:hypothetical protein